MPIFETDIRKICARLEIEGWLRMEGGKHRIYTNKSGDKIIPVPRGRGDLPQGTARSIAKAAGWEDKFWKGK
jgi:predicted RNA binding protein YcfA (HicA-like mRNA interferase family)